MVGAAADSPPPTPRPGGVPVAPIGAADPAKAPVVRDAAQPVRFRAVRRDGAPAAQVSVTLLDDLGRNTSNGSATTDGRGEVPVPRPGRYVLVATAPGYQPGAVALTVPDGPAAVEVLLVRSASVSGAVRGEGGPIACARVTLVQDGETVATVGTVPDEADLRLDLGSDAGRRTGGDRVSGHC